MRFWVFGIGLVFLAGCSNPTPARKASHIPSIEVRPLPINPGLTIVSLFGDSSSDLIINAFEMNTGTSMGVRVTVLANTVRLDRSAGDADEDSLFGPVTKDWKEGSFAAVPFGGEKSLNRQKSSDNKTYIDLEIHAGVCWHDDVQFFQSYNGSSLIGTYAVVASIKSAPHPNGYDDLTDAGTLVTVYKLKKAEPPGTGFAGIFAPIEFSPVMTKELPKASCHPSEMTPEYERLVPPN
jgi:hypothetical protein